MKRRNSSGVFIGVPLSLCAEIRRKYEKGIKTKILAKEYDLDRGTIGRLIHRVGGVLLNRSDSRSTFTSKQRIEIRKKYENGKNCYQLGLNYHVDNDTIMRAIRSAGGVVLRRPRKYFRNPEKERAIKSRYGLRVIDMDWMRKYQKGLCLWCRSELPKESLDCVVDHIGGKETLGIRKKVRGLCCSNGACNRLAGMVESNIFGHGLLTLFIKNVIRVVAVNKGNLPFPKKRHAS